MWPASLGWPALTLRRSVPLFSQLHDPSEVVPILKPSEGYRLDGQYFKVCYESPTVDFKEHARVIELTVLAARGRVHVIAGVGGNATSEAPGMTSAVWWP